MVDVWTRNLCLPQLLNKPPLAVADASRIFQAEIRRFVEVYIVVDALDECPGDREASTEFLAEIQKALSHIRLLVTSRHDVDTESNQPAISRLNIQANNNDVNAFLRIRNEEGKALASSSMNTSQRDTLIDKITEKASGG